MCARPSFYCRARVAVNGDLVSPPDDPFRFCERTCGVPETRRVQGSCALPPMRRQRCAAELGVVILPVGGNMNHATAVRVVRKKTQPIGTSGDERKRPPAANRAAYFTLTYVSMMISGSDPPLARKVS